MVPSLPILSRSLLLNYYVTCDVLMPFFISEPELSMQAGRQGARVG